mgnify:CR=1 FL=1
MNISVRRNGRNKKSARLISSSGDKCEVFVCRNKIRTVELFMENGVQFLFVGRKFIRGGIVAVDSLRLSDSNAMHRKGSPVAAGSRF